MSTATAKPRTGLVRIFNLPVDAICPSPENCKLYRPIDPREPAIIALAESLRRHGQQEDIVVTKDHYIISGHRRHAAARLAGMRFVRCRVQPFEKDDDHDRFVQLLREYNRQREKTNAEKLREELISTNADYAYETMIAERSRRASVDVHTIDVREVKTRAKISKAKLPMLEAMISHINSLREFWPLTDRLLHYELLNDPPLRHAGKPDSFYQNDRRSYKDLTDLVTRARLEGSIPFEAIADETRPMKVWNVYQDSQAFLSEQLGDFLTGYWRDLMQSQPNQIEIVGEKNTLGRKLEKIAMQYTIPLTLGRGYCCLDRRQEMAARYFRSGKERLVLLMLSDFDPDGEEIVHSFARSMRDDFGIDKITPIKVGLTYRQVKQFGLKNPQSTTDKDSKNAAKFVAKYGTDTHEIEALSPKRLHKILQDTIDLVIDTDAFNHELECERRDAAFIAAARKLALDALGGIDFDEEGK